MSLDQPATVTPAEASGASPAPPGGIGSGTEAEEPPRRRRGLIGLAIVLVAALVIGLGGSWVAYAQTDLPALARPSAVTRIQYSDGTTTLATLAVENRTPIPLGTMPKPVRDAVVAAQDPDFYDGNDSAVGAVLRAARQLTRSRDDAGRLSIAEQYVRSSLGTLDDGRLGRARVAILAQKLRAISSDDQIVRDYLNLKYFGRGAFGLQAASRAYFGVDAGKLTVAQGAVLASLIDDPTRHDPNIDEAGARRAWNAVLDAMVQHGFLDESDRSAQVYPRVLARTAADTGTWQNGSAGVLGSRIENELKKIGFSSQDIVTGGLIVRTTISPALQKAAEVASRRALAGDPAQETTTVSIDPATGAVRAYYGGERGYGNLDLASGAAPRPAGPSFEPFVLATAVGDGYGIDSVWSGTSLDAATRESSGAVFAKVTATVGPQRVVETARKAGISKLDGRTTLPNVDATVGLGRYSVSTTDQAAAYATLAGYGVSRQPYFIDSVQDSDGNVLWDHARHPTDAGQGWSKDVGRDVSYVLQKAYQADRSVQIGRPAAVKFGGERYRGTSDAWIGGYTPQLATVVWVGTTKAEPIPPAERSAGRIDVREAGLPGRIWREYMTTALAHQPVVPFEGPLHAGRKSAPE